MMDQNEINEAIHCYFGDTYVASFEKLKGGVSAEVYKVDLCHRSGVNQSIVLRCMGKSGLTTKQEFQLLDALHRGGLPVPRPIHLDDSKTILPTPYILMDYVYGNTGVETLQAKQQLGAMADALATVHKFPVQSISDLPTRLDPLEHRAQNLKQIFAARMLYLKVLDRPDVLHK